jgi:hypothetical protein
LRGKPWQLLVHDQVGPGVQAVDLGRREEGAVKAGAGDTEIVEQLEGLEGQVARLGIGGIGPRFWPGLRGLSLFDHRLVAVRRGDIVLTYQA